MTDETKESTEIVLDELTLTLRKPVKIGDVTYSALNLREPTAGEMAKAERGAATNIDMAIALISLVAGVPKMAIERLSQRDFQAVSDFLAGFTMPGPQTGETSSQK